LIKLARLPNDVAIL